MEFWRRNVNTSSLQEYNEDSIYVPGMQLLSPRFHSIRFFTFKERKTEVLQFIVFTPFLPYGSLRVSKMPSENDQILSEDNCINRSIYS